MFQTLRLSSITCLLALGALADGAFAETREEWLERRKLESAERREEAARKREERKQRAAEERAAESNARAERMDDLRRRREAAPREAQDAPAPRRETTAPSPAPAPLPRIPGQPTDAEMAAVVQARLDRDYNTPMRAMVKRCNTAAYKDDEEQQYCHGWFRAERWKQGPGADVKMTETPMTVGSMSVRQCTVEAKTQVYHCFVSGQINGLRPFNGGPMPAVDTIEVVRRPGGWQEVAPAR